MTEGETEISGFDDETIIREAACRLQKAFMKRFGFPMWFGSFEFVIHNGKLDKVEEQFRNRRNFLEERE